MAALVVATAVVFSAGCARDVDGTAIGCIQRQCDLERLADH